MKTGRCILALGCVFFVPILHAGDRSASEEVIENPSYVFIPGCYIRTMTPITATVTHRHLDRAFLQAANGQKISIGGFGSTPEIMKFIASLKENVSYNFPQVFLDHEKAMRGETLVITESAQQMLVRNSKQADSAVRGR
jgi:hypothetical protein